MQLNNLSNPGFNPVDGDDIEIIHDNGAIERKKYWAPLEEVDNRPEAHVATITPENPNGVIIVGNNDITCPINTKFFISGQLLSSANELIPLTATFRMPIKATDGRIRMLLVGFNEGNFVIEVTFKESGEWFVDESLINSNLPSEQHMRFNKITAFVYDA